MPFAEGGAVAEGGGRRRRLVVRRGSAAGGERRHFLQVYHVDGHVRQVVRNADLQHV